MFYLNVNFSQTHNFSLKLKWEILDDFEIKNLKTFKIKFTRCGKQKQTSTNTAEIVQ